jgi:hypothetical protein
LQDNVLVPDEPSVTLVGESVQVRPVLGEMLSERATVPANPRTLVTTTVDDPEVPALTATLVGLAERVKSWTVTVIVTKWVSEPLLPVTVTV